MKLMPDQPVPALAVDTLAGKRFDIAKQAPKNFTQILFYRGMHCMVCQGYLKSYDAKLAEFEKHGIETIAISMEGRDRAGVGPIPVALVNDAGGQSLVFRNRSVPGAARPTPLLRFGAEHAIRAPDRGRHAVRPRRRAGPQLPRSRHGVTRAVLK